MDRYTHVLQGELAGALDALPDLSQGPVRQTARAAGTDDSSLSNLSPSLSPGGGIRCSSVESDGVKTASGNDAKTTEDPSKNAVFEARNGEGGIRTPGTRINEPNGLANRRIQPLCHLSLPVLPGTGSHLTCRPEARTALAEHVPGGGDRPRS